MMRGTEDGLMRVQFTQSGGIMGTIRQCALDTATLPVEQSETLAKLVQRADASSSRQSLSKSGRDLEEYEIALHDGDRTIKLLHDQSTLPENLKPLVAYLKKYARPVAP